MRGLPKLTEGTFRHPTCGSCDARRGMKTRIDSQTRWIVRTTQCRGAVVDFSVLLQIDRPTGWTDVTRYSIAHSNFHQYLPGDRRHEFGPVDSLYEVARAYTMAVNQGFDHTGLWLADWYRRTPR